MSSLYNNQGYPIPRTAEDSDIVWGPAFIKKHQRQKEFLDQERTIRLTRLDYYRTLAEQQIPLGTQNNFPVKRTNPKKD